MTTGPIETQIVREIVRGVRPLNDLRTIGISFRITSDEVSVLGTVGNPIPVSCTDVARGWLQHSGNEADLRQWAKFIHGAMTIVELDFGDSSEADELLGAIWSAAFGEAISAEMNTAARRCLMGQD